MSSRRDFKNTNRNPREDRGKPAGRRGNGLFLGMVLGLVGGLVIVGLVVWLFYPKPSEFKTPERAPEVVAPVMPVQSEPPPVTEAPVPAPRTSEARPSESPRAGAGAVPAPYSFYDILPGSKPPKPVEAPKPKEVWWLQVAALKSPEDANRLKARLIQLKLTTVVQRTEGADASPLYRVRVGPFVSEDAALGALDTLALNNFEPRLLKEAVSPEEKQ